MNKRGMRLTARNVWVPPPPPYYDGLTDLYKFSDKFNAEPHFSYLTEHYVQISVTGVHNVSKINNVYRYNSFQISKKMNDHFS